MCPGGTRAVTGGNGGNRDQLPVVMQAVDATGRGDAGAGRYDDRQTSSGWNLQRASTHPGEMLREEFLIPLGITQNALALKIRVPATRIGDIIHGKRAITPDTALRLARFFGNSPEFWLNLQQMHDLSKARLELSKTIERDVEAYARA